MAPRIAIRKGRGAGAFRERVVEQTDRAEVVRAAETADGVVVLCRRSKLLTAAVVECGATTAPRDAASARPPCAARPHRAA